MDEKAKITKETVEEAIGFILEEGRCQGYQEAMKVYGQQYKEIIRKGRIQGVIISAVALLSGAIIYKVNKNKNKNKEDKIKVHDVKAEDVTFEEFEV